jgi:hypothetical protein
MITQPDFLQCQGNVQAKAKTGKYGTFDRCESQHPKILIVSHFTKEGKPYEGKADTMTMCPRCYLDFISHFPDGRVRGYTVNFIVPG